MVVLEFDPNGYTVSHQNDTIELLAKEYQLLQFLYHNRDKAFTRDQLLDRLWCDEFPVERTVDDHIYRLRKKLKNWGNWVSINTIRGYGYSLTLNQTNRLHNPSLQDDEMKQHITKMFEKYHKYGQGKSMIAIAQQQDLLGVEVDPFYQIYLRFIQGDIDWFLTATEVPMRERLYWLLLLYKTTSFDSEQSLYFFEKVIAANVLPPDQHRELRILNILQLYVDTGQLQKVQELLVTTHQVIEREQLQGFRLPLAITEAYILLCADEDVRIKIAEIEQMVNETPYLREIGSLLVLKGLWLLKQNDKKEAIASMDQGLEVLRLSQHIPLEIRAVHQILKFVQLYWKEPDILHKYSVLWRELEQKYDLGRHKQSIEKILIEYLSSI